MTEDKQEGYTLLKMLPEQVSNNWDFLAPYLELSMPPMVMQRRARMANVLRAVLVEDLIVWGFWDKDKNLKYVLSTVVQTDKVSLVKDLLIYSFTSVDGQIGLHHLKIGIEILQKYAKNLDCLSILAYVDEPTIKAALERMGGKSNFNLIQIPT